MAQEPIRTIDLFAGIGGIRMGFDQAFVDRGCETVFVSEFDRPATKTYALNYDTPSQPCDVDEKLLMCGGDGQAYIYGDITKIDENQVPDHDILLGGFPCLTSDTQVLMADKTSKRIDEIKVDDLVATHDGKTHKVLAVMDQGVHKVYEMTAGEKKIRATGNHYFLTARTFDNGEGEIIKWASVDEMRLSPKGVYKIAAVPSWEPGHDECVFIPVSDINECGEEQVWDIEVDEIHAFIANGLVSHNCQAFSMAGKKAGFNDNFKGRTRGTLFFDVARIIEAKKPKVVFCENVKNLKHHDKGNTYRVIKATLEELGYDVYEEVLNAKNFGVPQKRERIYIVAFRKDIAPDTFEFPQNAGTPKTISDILEPAPIPSKYYISDTYYDAMKRHRTHHEALGHGFGYEIISLDDIANTIVCGGMGRERNLIIDHREHSMEPMTNIKGKINDEDIRKLTPRECARCQGFPDTYKFAVSDTQIYKQTGNSVCVPVIKAIAEAIKAAVGDKL